MASVSLSFAQTKNNKGHAYKIHKSGSTTTVYNLGANPEFVFLRNLTTPEQVLAALNSDRNKKKYPRQMKEINRLLKNAGFTNGIKDVTLANISEETVPPGTTGTMGNGGLRYGKARMAGKPKKAWKITSDDGRSVSFFSRCGNAFYADNFGAEKSNSYTGCKEVPVNISPESKEITIDNVPLTHSTKKTYVYYRKGCGCSGCTDMDVAYEQSKPLLIKKEDIVEQVPQTYKVTTTGTGTATVCKGKTMDVRPDLSIEKESEYLGYTKPSVTKVYKEVSRKEYKRWLRLKKQSDNIY